MELLDSKGRPKLAKSKVDEDNPDLITPDDGTKKPKHNIPCNDVKNSKWKKSKTNMLKSKRVIPKAEVVESEQTRP